MEPNMGQFAWHTAKAVYWRQVVAKASTVLSQAQATCSELPDSF